MLVVQAFQNDHIVALHLLSRWHDMKLKYKNMRFHVSHIYMEGIIVLISSHALVE